MMITKDELLSELQDNIEVEDSFSIYMTLAIYFNDFREQQIRKCIIDLLGDTKDAETVASAFFACFNLNDDIKNLKRYIERIEQNLFDLMDLSLQGISAFISPDESYNTLNNIFLITVFREFEQSDLGYQVALLYFIRTVSLLGHKECVGKYKDFIGYEIIERAISDNIWFFYDCFSSLGDCVLESESIKWNEIALDIVQNNPIIILLLHTVFWGKEIKLMSVYS